MTFCFIGTVLDGKYRFWGKGFYVPWRLDLIYSLFTVPIGRDLLSWIMFQSGTLHCGTILRAWSFMLCSASHWLFIGDWGLRRCSPPCRLLMNSRCLLVGGESTLMVWSHENEWNFKNQNCDIVYTFLSLSSESLGLRVGCGTSKKCKTLRNLSIDN